MKEVIKVLSFVLKVLIRYKMRKGNEKNISHWDAFEKSSSL